MENFVKVPVASHGLHRHKFNYPVLGSMNFMDMCPVFYEPLRLGEKINLKAGFLSRLSALTNPAFMTGRFIFKGFFCPYKFVFRPWNNFITGTEYNNVAGSSNYIASAPYMRMGKLSSMFFDISHAMEEVQSTVPSDVVYLESGSNTPRYFNFGPIGATLFKMLNSLGYSPTWIADDNTVVNILPILSFIRIGLDYYWPKAYVNSNDYLVINGLFKLEQSNYDAQAGNIALALITLSSLFYSNSVFDLAWENPLGPNLGTNEQNYTIKDVSNDALTVQEVTNDPLHYAGSSNSPSTSIDQPANRTPFVGSNGRNSDAHNAVGVVTKYVLDSLESLSLFMKRRQIAGARLIDRFLVSRGVKLSNEQVERPYFVGKCVVEIGVDPVENNSDTNLGELAGKATAASQDIKFDCEASSDGIFIVVASLVPDCDMPLFNDPYHFRVSQNDFYQSEFDKLGAEAIPQLSVYTSMQQYTNSLLKGKVFGFLNRYYADVIDRPRLFGDFRVQSRGSASLRSFYGFRLFDEQTIQDNSGLAQSQEFVASHIDKEQYQRFFYNEKSDNIMVFLRWYGSTYKSKLPLGDSYDWDDDEFNEKVTLLQNEMI